MDKLAIELIRGAPTAGVAVLVMIWFMTRNEKRLDSNAAAINRMAQDTAKAINEMGERTSAAITQLAERTSAAITDSAQRNAEAMVDLARAMGMGK